MGFVHLEQRPESLSPQWVQQQYAELEKRALLAEQNSEATDWLALFADWNETKSYLESECGRLSFQFTKDLNDEAAEEAERAHREEITPAAEKGDAALVASLLASRHRDAITARYGDQLLRVLQVSEPTLAPANSALRVEAGALVTEYDKRVASAEVEVEGQVLTLERARALFCSPNPATRRAAYDAYHGWYAQNREPLARIYGELVELRDHMAKNLGDENFVTLGYAGMQRTDYGPGEAAAFRASVLQHASPLFEELCKRQAASLGTPSLRPWDMSYFPQFSLPMGVAEPIGEQLDKLGRAFQRLSPRLAVHFERMREEGLIDLENRKGKAAGAYCDAFSDEERVVIFCNSTGDEGDIGTLCHEMGHAFQGWESLWIDAVDLRWPSADACEIHSMGMEYLSLSYLDEFLSPDQLETFSRNRWREGLSLISYVCVIDEFQHWVYEHPRASLDERDEEFVAIRDRYMPGIDWSGEGEATRALRWYAQMHLFSSPFYYIDYAIAETGAMQLAMLDVEDHGAALEKYHALCQLGGTKSLSGLLQSAGLRSPFGGELVGELMAHAARQIGLG